MNTEAVGKRIADRRKELGLTQEQLAEKIGVSPQAVSKWENGVSRR
ncbi:MAG: helix-turn-helix transcriptional regulator [Clostridia bacterium]|nr:helix-turn-helix transcriptional regulator [Clostridia bacterium]